MDVSKNGGTQQPLVFLLKMIILGCFGGTPIFGNTHMGWGLIMLAPDHLFFFCFFSRRSSFPGARVLQFLGMSWWHKLSKAMPFRGKTWSDSTRRGGVQNGEIGGNCQIVESHLHVWTTSILVLSLECQLHEWWPTWDMLHPSYIPKYVIIVHVQYLQEWFSYHFICTRFRTGLFWNRVPNSNILLITGVFFRCWCSMASLAGPGSAKDPNLEDGQQKHGKKAWEKLMVSNRFGECTNISKSFVCSLFIYYILFLSIFLKIQTSFVTSLVQSN